MNYKSRHMLHLNRFPLTVDGLTSYLSHVKTILIGANGQPCYSPQTSDRRPHLKGQG
jgi:hypothetical protein